MITRAEQIAHLSVPENLKLFQANHGRDVEGYFADYYEEYEQDNGRPGDALYKAVCADLGLVPLKGWPGFEERRANRRQKSIQWAADSLKVPLSGERTRILGKLYDLGYGDAGEDAKRVQQ